MRNSPLILASASPRRSELLAAAGLKFEVVNPDVLECSSRQFSMRELTLRNAVSKSLAVAHRRLGTVVLGADTLVSLEGQAIGKPVDLFDAFRILQRLNGREHEVCTSVCLYRGRARTFSVISQVQFRKLSAREIQAYLAKINPLDKAGAYAAQGHGAEIIERIRGSYTNVVGLPMEETLAALREFGIT